MRRLLPWFKLRMLLAWFLAFGSGGAAQADGFAEAAKLKPKRVYLWSTEEDSLLVDIRDGTKRAFPLWGNYVDYIKFRAKLIDSKGSVKADIDFKDRVEALVVPKDFDGTIQLQGTIGAVYGIGWRDADCKFVRFRMRVRTDHLGRISIEQPVPPHGIREIRQGFCPEIMTNLFDYFNDIEINLDLITNTNSSIILAPSLVGSKSLAVSVGVPVIAVSKTFNLSGLTTLSLPHLELKVVEHPPQ